MGSQVQAAKDRHHSLSDVEIDAAAKRFRISAIKIAAISVLGAALGAGVVLGINYGINRRWSLSGNMGVYLGTSCALGGLLGLAGATIRQRRQYAQAMREMNIQVPGGYQPLWVSGLAVLFGGLMLVAYMGVQGRMEWSPKAIGYVAIGGAIGGTLGAVLVPVKEIHAVHRVLNKARYDAVSRTTESGSVDSGVELGDIDGADSD